MARRVNPDLVTANPRQVSSRDITSKNGPPVISAHHYRADCTVFDYGIVYEKGVAMMARVVIGIEMRALLQIFLSSFFSISIFVSHFPMADSDGRFIGKERCSNIERG